MARLLYTVWKICTGQYQAGLNLWTHNVDNLYGITWIWDSDITWSPTKLSYFYSLINYIFGFNWSKWAIVCLILKTFNLLAALEAGSIEEVCFWNISCSKNISLIFHRCLHYAQWTIQKYPKNKNLNTKTNAFIEVRLSKYKLRLLGKRVYHEPLRKPPGKLMNIFISHMCLSVYCRRLLLNTFPHFLTLLYMTLHVDQIIKFQ